MANEKRLIKVIDATAVYNGIALYMAENAYLNDTALDVLKMVAGWLNEAPTVDAVEVVHGVWVEVGDGVAIGKGTHFECSACRTWTSWGRLSKYCPNCGAKMNRGEET